MRDRRYKKLTVRAFAVGTGLSVIVGTFAAPLTTMAAAKDMEKPVVLRICNWEEYIDEGGWEDDELIDLPSEDIFGENSLVSDFEEWYYETYGVPVKVEYSTFGTNEELYSQLNLGNEYDLVCPSDYMIMKLMKENKLEPLSDEFFDDSNENNYYVKGVSPYIDSVFHENEIDGEPWSDYAAGYMWGITGMVYNPEEVTEEEASTWSILENEKFYRQVTIKDNVRDAYFPTLAILNKNLLNSTGLRNRSDYHEQLSAIMNDTRKETIDESEQKLKEIRQNVYSFETDSGKADMITGKVVANLQWSGDGVYTMDQAEEDGLELSFAVPKEASNLWFDGWCMLKKGVRSDAKKQQAAEAFVNFLSRPDNVIKNMYYIGYTSVISGGDSPLIYEYADWCYGAEDEDTDTVPYSLRYFFTEEDENASQDYVLQVPVGEERRQVFAGYPPRDVITRSAIMQCFDDEQNKRISRMWTNIRCFEWEDLF